MVSTVGACLAHQSRQSVLAVALEPTLGRAQRHPLLARESRQGHAVFHIRLQQPEAGQGAGPLLVGERRQRGHA
jgi:hypothetical protein